MFAGRSFFESHFVICQVLGSICNVACGLSSLNMSALSYNRYLLVCKQETHKKVFTPRNSVALCMLFWIASSLTLVVDFIDWGGFFYDRDSLMCLWDRFAFRSKLYFVSAILFLTVLVVTINYLRIYLYTKKRQNTSMVGKKKAIRITKGLFYSFSFFAIISLPYAITNLIDFDYKLPSAVVMYATKLVHLNSALNPIIYAVVNPAFKKGYWQFLTMCCPSAPAQSTDNNQICKMSNLSNAKVRSKMNSVF